MIYRVTGGSEGKRGRFAHRRSSGIFKETKVTNLRSNARQHLIREGHTAAPGNPHSRHPTKAGLSLLSHLLQGQGLWSQQQSP